MEQRKSDEVLRFFVVHRQPAEEPGTAEQPNKTNLKRALPAGLLAVSSFAYSNMMMIHGLTPAFDSLNQVIFLVGSACKTKYKGEKI